MHENFLNYIMIGLSRGLFSAAPQPARHFDEEAFLRQQVAARREQREVSAATRSVQEQPGPKPEEPEPSGSRRHARRLKRQSSGLPCGQTCRAA